MFIIIGWTDLVYYSRIYFALKYCIIWSICILCTCSISNWDSLNIFFFSRGFLWFSWLPSAVHAWIFAYQTHVPCAKKRFDHNTALIILQYSQLSLSVFQQYNTRVNCEIWWSIISDTERFTGNELNTIAIHLFEEIFWYSEMLHCILALWTNCKTGVLNVEMCNWCIMKKNR